MSKIAFIGGTGLTDLETVTVTRRETVETPFGFPSAPLVFGNLHDKEVIFLARHGKPHKIPPHKVNYRANIHALHAYNARRIIAINAVGGITSDMGPCRIVVPDQIIDYTWSRAHTFFEENIEHVTHVDFTSPYTDTLRQLIIECAADAGIAVAANGTYGATQGPRLESVAEIKRMERDGCDIVGMTGMPEAALARELDLEYASISLVVNWAAGKSGEDITMEIIEGNLAEGMKEITRLLDRVTARL